MHYLAYDPLNLRFDHLTVHLSTHGVSSPDAFSYEVKGATSTQQPSLFLWAHRVEQSALRNNSVSMNACNRLLERKLFRK